MGVDVSKFTADPYQRSTWLCPFIGSLFMGVFAIRTLLFAVNVNVPDSLKPSSDYWYENVGDPGLLNRGLLAWCWARTPSLGTWSLWVGRANQLRRERSREREREREHKQKGGRERGSGRNRQRRDQEIEKWRLKGPTSNRCLTIL